MKDKVEKTREKGTTEGSIRRQEEINFRCGDLVFFLAQTLEEPQADS